MAVTIKDVANLAGVSPSTVSRTCKNHPSISNETKERVRYAIAQLGYEPNLSTSTDNNCIQTTIGIILPPSDKEAFENSFYLEVIRGISQFCNKHGYINTVITGQSDDEILSIIKNLEKNDMSNGFILLYSKQEDAVIDYLYNSGLLYVLIGKAYKYANQTVYIDNDNILAGKDATDYLCRLGHKKIAYIGSDNNMIFSADRKSGYMRSLEENKINYVPEYCLEFSSTQTAAEPIRILLHSENRPTAIVVSDDIYGVIFERVCAEEGIKIPNDISIISFNNSLFARLTSSQLTSIDINSVQLGIEASSQLINHIENPNLMATKIIVPHILIERSSCKQVDTIK